MGWFFRLTSACAWDKARRCGFYYGGRLDHRDGFIHFSKPHQLLETARRYFSGRRDLVLLLFHAADFDSALRQDPSRGGDLFYHLYAPLPVEKLRQYQDLPDGWPEDDTALRAKLTQWMAGGNLV